MKNAAKTPGKLLAGLCLILFFCLMPVRSYAAEQQLSEITKLYVTGIYGSETLPQQKVNWQYADKGYYLCMPSGADLSNVQLHFTENSDGNENADSYVMIGGQKINCGDSTDLSGTSKLQISLAGGKSVSVNIVKSAEIPAMFIQTASGTLDKVHASKDNKEKGTMALVKADRSVDFDGNLKQIKGRGNSTWGFAKKPYNIKLENSSDLLGMFHLGICEKTIYYQTGKFVRSAWNGQGKRLVPACQLYGSFSSSKSDRVQSGRRDRDSIHHGQPKHRSLYQWRLHGILSYHRKNRNRKNESQHYGSGRCHK